jgi:hypothetical protein
VWGWGWGAYGDVCQKQGRYDSLVKNYCTGMTLINEE